MTTVEFVDRLRHAAPEAQQLVDEHLANFDEVLLHLLVARVRDLTIAAFDRGDQEIASRLLEAFDKGNSAGDDAVENAVAVSFVEDSQWWDPARREFIESWPEGLREEADRQRKWWASSGRPRRLGRRSR